jgi:hypothetical protein
MRKTGKRIWLYLAGYAVSAAGVLAIPAQAADLATPVTMAAAVQVESPSTSMALSPIAAAMDLMRSGRSPMRWRCSNRQWASCKWWAQRRKALLPA